MVDPLGTYLQRLVQIWYSAMLVPQSARDPTPSGCIYVPSYLGTLLFFRAKNKDEISQNLGSNLGWMAPKFSLVMQVNCVVLFHLLSHLKRLYFHPSSAEHRCIMWWYLNGSSTEYFNQSYNGPDIGA